MSESHFDEYEHFNYDQDKKLYSGHSGKQRSKKEASEHTNHFDPSGHTRKITDKLQNLEHNKKPDTTLKPKTNNKWIYTIGLFYLYIYLDLVTFFDLWFALYHNLMSYVWLSLSHAQAVVGLAHIHRNSAENVFWSSYLQKMD